MFLILALATTHRDRAIGTGALAIAPVGDGRAERKWGNAVETPKYLQTLWSYKWLLAFGLIVAIIAAFFAGFTITNGQVESRAVKSYTAGTTVLVTSPTDTLYQAQIPSQPIEQGVSAPEPLDLSASTQIYAYIVAGARVKDAVEAEVGRLDDDTESITAIRRTTQPAGDERFPGGLKLPVLEVVGTAPTEDRAEEISRTATATFLGFVAAEQEAQQIAPENRVELEVLTEGAAVEGETSNPAIPIIITGVRACSSRSSPLPSSSPASGRVVRSAPSRVDASAPRHRSRAKRSSRMMRPSARRPTTPTTTCSSAPEPGRTEHRHDRCRRRAGGRRRSGRRRDVLLGRATGRSPARSPEQAARDHRRRGARGRDPRRGGAAPAARGRAPPSGSSPCSCSCAAPSSRGARRSSRSPR